MKKASKYIIIILIILVLGFLFYFAHGEIINSFREWHNKKIDYSCNVDDDCVVKRVSMDPCGINYRCVNKNSVVYVSQYKAPGRDHTVYECTSEPIKPTECKCEDNTCVSYVCRDEKCVRIG